MRRDRFTPKPPTSSETTHLRIASRRRRFRAVARKSGPRPVFAVRGLDPPVRVLKIGSANHIAQYAEQIVGDAKYNVGDADWIEQSGFHITGPTTASSATETTSSDTQSGSSGPGNETRRPAPHRRERRAHRRGRGADRPVRELKIESDDRIARDGDHIAGTQSTSHERDGERTIRAAHCCAGSANER